MWIRRLLVIPILLGLAALAAYLYFVYEAPPDARLACHYGAYTMSDGRAAVVTPSSGVQSLRIVFMDGHTDWLKPEPRQSGVPRTFAGTPGWLEDAPAHSKVEFGACDDGTIAFEADGQTLTGHKETFDVYETTFESHGLKLFGRLVMPRVEGAVPVAVLVHGSEWSSAVLFNRLQYLLPANGIGAFVYDKRGTGRSEGRYTQDFDLLADDAAAALMKAREIAGTLGSDFGFQGGSQAGWIEPLAATKTKTDFVLVGFGLAESPLAEDRDEVFDDLRTAGYGDDVIEKAREITDATGRVVASHFKEGYEELDAVREKYRNETWYAKAKGEFTGSLLNNPNWMIRIVGPFFDVGTPMTYDPIPPLNAYEGPHLWILAGRDSSAPSENTLRILREVQETRPNLDVVLFPTADHGILEFEERDGRRFETRFSEGYFRLMVDWLLFRDTKVDVEGPVVYRGAAREAAPATP
jgi:uncharacterized protein